MLLQYPMRRRDTGLRAPYMDTLRAPPICPSVVVPQRVVGVLVGGDILCCHLPSGVLTGPLYEDPKRVP